MTAAALLFLMSCGIEKSVGTQGDGHPDKPHVAAALAEFRFMLVAVKSKLKSFRN